MVFGSFAGLAFWEQGCYHFLRVVLFLRFLFCCLSDGCFALFARHESLFGLCFYVGGDCLSFVACFVLILPVALSQCVLALSQT